MLTAGFVCALSGSLIPGLALSILDPQEGSFRGAAACAAAILAAVSTVLLILSHWPEEKLQSRLFLTATCLFAWLILTNMAHLVIAPLNSGSRAIWFSVAGPISFQGALLALVWGMLRRHGYRVSEAFGLDVLPKRAALAGFALALLAVPAGWGLQRLCAMALEMLGYPAREQMLVEMLRSAAWPIKIYYVFTALILAPLAEEVLFRGILYPKMKQLGSPGLALWGSSILFAMTHMNAQAFIPLTLLAVSFALLYEKTGNLLAPVAAHSGFNALNFTLLIYQVISSSK